MALNVTTAVFAENCNTATASPSLAQWDTEQVLQISGIELPDSYKVEFSTVYTRNAIPKIGDASGVAIPNELLQRSAPITAYIVLYGENGGRNREYWITIYITPGQPPETITPDPEQTDVIDQAIGALQSGVAKAEAAAEAIQDMGVEAETLAAGSAASVEKTVDPETGAVTLSFGIPKGATGDPGYSPTIQIAPITGGHRITVTDRQGSASFDVMDGEQGNPGTPGDDGYSPAVTITTITGGHRVTITDKTHPSGQSFDVMDGVIQSVNGKSAASITLDAGDIAYDDSETYQNGSVGAELSDLSRQLSDNRITTLDTTALAGARIVEAVGNPVYVDDVTDYPAYNLTDTGWYVFARITAPKGKTAGGGTTVTGAAGAIITSGAAYIDVAVRFEVAAVSQEVTINWGTETETFVFKATDLAIRNLDYRVTFYVYDISPFCSWTYELTTDTTFGSGKYYYTKDENDEYTLAEVTVGETVPADTYYVHAGLTIEGMTRNVTYQCPTPVDCPVEFVLPAIEDETHGAWFECRFRFMGAYSITLTVPTGVKVATEHTQKEKAGINMVDLHYTNIDDVKLWRFLNTASSIPA